MISGIIFGLAVFMAASSGAIFKPDDWYFKLNKPSWTPPNWAFPLVWTILYIGIAYAGWLVWQQQDFGLLLVVWIIQLCLNAAWSWLFFGRRRMDHALYEVAALWLSIVAFIVIALQQVPMAAYLFVPYLLWVSTAAFLNYTVLKMNPDAMAR